MMQEPKLIQVGKKGATPEILGEIRILLRKHRSVKVKLLKSSRQDSGRHELSEQITSQIKARKHQLRGNILTLYS